MKLIKEEKEIIEKKIKAIMGDEVKVIVEDEEDTITIALLLNKNSELYKDLLAQCNVKEHCDISTGKYIG